MSITFHFPDSGAQLTPWLPRIRTLLTATAQDVTRLLPLDRLDVMTYASEMVIPELGANGFAEGAHLLHLKLDPRSAAFARHIETAIPALFAHEVHHCMRGRSVGYGRTLRGALVSEGLACHFEAELTARVPFYASALDPAQIDAMKLRMASHLDSPWYDHAAWFYGNPQAEIPRLCGYSVGFALVGDWLARHGSTASAAVALPAAAFFD